MSFIKAGFTELNWLTATMDEEEHVFLSQIICQSFRRGAPFYKYSKESKALPPDIVCYKLQMYSYSANALAKVAVVENVWSRNPRKTLDVFKQKNVLILDGLRRY